MSVSDFSALHCPPRRDSLAPAEKTTLRDWKVEQTGTHSPSTTSSPQIAHPCFTPSTGTYTVAVDGLYTLVVQIIPIGGARYEHSSPTRRSWVDYVIRVQEPIPDDTHPEDAIESEYYDVGSVNFQQVVHWKKGTLVSCLRMPQSTPAECVRLKIDLLQRKRKRPAPPELSKKELKKRKKMKRKAESIASSYSSGPANEQPDSTNYSGRTDTSRVQDTTDDDDNDNDSDWSQGFESDTTADELPHSKRGVGRLAKRFKSAASAHLSA